MILRISYLLPIVRVQMLYFSLFCAFFIFSHQAIAQEPTTTVSTSISEETQLFISQSDSIEKIQNLILDTFEKEKDTLLGLTYCATFLKRGKEQENDEIQYFSSYQIAFIEYNRSHHKQALKHAYASVKAADRLNDTISIISSNILLGSTWYVFGAYDEALTAYFTAKELSTHIENASCEIICLANIANTRVKLNRYRDALKSFDLIIETLDEGKQVSFIQFKETYLSALLGKGLCLTELKSYREAEETYDKGITLAEANNLPTYKGYFYINLGNLFYEKTEYHKSLGIIKQGKDILQKHSGLQTNKHIANLYIAKCYFQLEKYEEALVLLDQNFESIGSNVEADKVEDMYELAIAIAKVQDDQEKQIFYMSKSQHIEKIKSDKKLSAKDILHEDDIKEYDLENQKLEREKTENIIDKRIVIAISIALFILLIFVFLAYRQKTKLKEQRFLKIIENIKQNAVAHTSEKTSQNTQIKDEKAQAILDELEKLEDTHFYLSQDATLHTTAKLLNTNTTYLSKALNAVKKQSFNQYLNKLRIDYVLVKLKEDAVFRSYTIHAVSKEIGYKSATTFIKEFKNKTGLNPSYYIKKIEG